MNLSSCVIIYVTSVALITISVAGENVNLKKNIPKKDPIIDDDEGEGSGFVESGYDQESSGSGYGPDDEDSAHEHGLPVDLNTKSGKTRPSLKTLPLPIVTPKSVPASSSSPPKTKPDTTQSFDVNQRENSEDIAPSGNKNFVNFNSNGASNTNQNLPENENSNRDINMRKNNDDENNFEGRHPDEKMPVDEDNRIDSSGDVSKVNTPDRDRATSFFAQPGILAAVIGGAVVGLLCAILVVMFIVYRMRKKDEGSYPLEEMKRCPANNPYMKPNHREFFA